MKIFYLRKPKLQLQLIISRCFFCNDSKLLRSASCDNFSVTKFQPVFRTALQYQGRVAIQDENGLHTYEDIYYKSVCLAKEIQNKIGGSRKQERIAFLCPNNVTYVITQWAIWNAGHVAVPLSPLHPVGLLSYYIEDCQAALAISSTTFSNQLSTATYGMADKISTIILDDLWSQATATKQKKEPSRSDFDFKYNEEDYALILYTSGTTGKPKGVVLSHKNLNAQTGMLIKAWEWSASDVIVHSLPLHHTHGVVNALLCPLYVGARCILLPKFDASLVWSNLLGTNLADGEKPTIFMGVPTMYSKLLEEYESKYYQSPHLREYVKAVCSSKIRVMISGSAALPEPVFHKWHLATGHKIVERYGMTEVGSVLSIPVRGERRPGFVGIPTSGVRVRIAEFPSSPLGIKGPYTVVAEGSSAAVNSAREKDVVGDLLIKGPTVFQRYWNKPEATEKEFTKDGWFRTGDVAEYRDGYFKILGRSSADIIKSGGYKISSLEIETHLLGHPDILDCTVLGIPDPTWGQRVAAVVVLRDGKMETDLQALKSWCKQRMAPYTVPTEWRFVSALPRNTLGKVNKVEYAKNAFQKQI